MSHMDICFPMSLVARSIPSRVVTSVAEITADVWAPESVVRCCWRLGSHISILPECPPDVSSRGPSDEVVMIRMSGTISTWSSGYGSSPRIVSVRESHTKTLVSTSGCPQLMIQSSSGDTISCWTSLLCPNSAVRRQACQSSFTCDEYKTTGRAYKHD